MYEKKLRNEVHTTVKKVNENLVNASNIMRHTVYVDSLITSLKNVQPIFGPDTYLERWRKV